MSTYKGFSLLELLITVAIIAILAGVAVPAYQTYADRAQDMDAQMVLRSIGSAQERHRMLAGGYFNQGGLPSQQSTDALVAGLLGGVRINAKYYFFSIVSVSSGPPPAFVARASSRRQPSKFFTIDQNDCLRLNGAGPCL
jgi:prepilin-type N-terminal cleavage/methylation domain-containing protein